MAFPSQCHVDLETLDTAATARILSIGAVFKEETFYAEIDTSLYNQEFTTSEATMRWWDRQGGFQPSTTPMPPYEAITKFQIWLSGLTISDPDYEVWANSPSFDCAILRNHLKAFNLRCPWEFWQERDVRTIKNLAVSLNLGIRFPKNPHNALQDAANQRILVESVQGALGQHIQLSREARYKGFALTTKAADG